MIESVDVIKRKTALLPALMLVFFALLLPVSVFLEQRHSLETEIREADKGMVRFMENHIKRISTSCLVRLQVIAESQDFLSAFSSNDMQKTHGILARRLALLENDMPHAAGINLYGADSSFVLKTGKMKYPASQPGSHLDAVKASNEELTPVSGFELYDGVVYYRIIRPVTNPQGRLLGSIELIIAPQYFLETLRTIQPDLLSFIGFASSTGEPFFIAEPWYAEAVNTYASSGNKRFSLSSKTYVRLEGMSLNNYKGEPTASLKAFYDITLAQKSVMEQTFLYAFFSFLLFSVIYLIILKRFKALDRYCAEREKKASELTEIFNGGHVVLIKWESSFSRNVGLCTENIRKLTGYPQSAFYSGQVRYTSLINKDDLGSIASEIDKAVKDKSKEAALSPYRITTEDGGIKWVYESLKIVRDDMGELKHMLGYLTDITGIYSGVYDLKLSLERWELSAGASQAGLWYRDMLTDELYFSKGWKEQFGYSENSIKNTTQAWNDLVHADDAEDMKQCEEKLLSGETDHIRCEFRQRCSDGGYRWISLSGRAFFNEDGRAVRCAGICTDITERKSRETALKQEAYTLQVLMENLPVPVFYEDKNLRFMGANRRFMEFMDIDPADAADKSEEIGLYGAVHTTYGRLALEDVGRMNEYEADISAGSGRRKVIVYKRAFRDAEGEPAGVIGAMIDITEMKSLQRMLMNNADEVHRAKKDLDDAQSLAKIGSWRFETGTGRMVWSDEHYKILGLENSSVIPSFELFMEFVYTKDREKVRSAVDRALRNYEPFSVEHVLNIPEHGQKHVHMRGNVIMGDDGKAAAVIGTIQDVTDIKNAQIALDRTNAMLSEYAEIVDKNVIISRTDYDGKILYVSEAFCRAAEKTRDELIGRKHNVIAHPDMDKNVYKDLWDTVKAGRIWEGEIKNRSGRGSDYWINATISPTYGRDGKISGFTAVCSDITVKKQMERLSVTDPLTGLYNRLKLDSVFGSEIQRCERYGCALSAIIIDVDGFKAINDKYGHQTGDIVLKGVADVLCSNIRKTDTIGRWGGEEFLIICPETEVEGAVLLAEKVRRSVQDNDFVIVSEVTCSIGVCSYEAGMNESLMMKYADQALYKAKKQGRNRVVVHTKDSETDTF